MFAYPDAKRVRREDLYDSSADEDDVRDEEVDAALRDKLNAQLSGLFSFSAADTSNDAQQQQQQDQQQQQHPDAAPDHLHDNDDAEEDLAFSFRLFRDEAPSHKVVLEKDEALEQPGGGEFVVARRPTSYYLAEEPTQDVLESFRAAAVTSDYLFQDAGKRRWGLEKPWRVTNITISTKGVGLSSLNGHAGVSPTMAGAEPTAGEKKRPGKRRRIILRTRQKARKEREEAEKLKLVEKEQHLMDKKKRLNREKKLKRRAKEREKKYTMTGEGAASEPDSSKATSPE